MVFNSLEYAFFLPIVFILYWFCCNRDLRLQNLLIVLVSYVFYGWWNWRFLVLIAFTSLCSWGSGLLIERYRDNSKVAKMVSVTNIVINLVILGIFKYYNFFVTSFADIFYEGNADGLLLQVVLPVGISFYTFQALSYSLDVYKGKIEATYDIIAFFAYISFFPQLVAGPIERATNLLPQMLTKREFDYVKAVDGCRQILWGLFKKVVVADNCATIANQIFSTYQDQSGSVLLVGSLFFAFQIYGDFSGYSDIAIGTAKLFGIKLMQNFRTPYFSRDIAEFWRRWHISLTTWFRDYVYIPLGGSRCSKIKIVRNTFIIFLVSGFWHGANWTFLMWGVYHAILFLPLILLGKNRKNTNIVAEGRLFPTMKEAIQMILTFLLVVIGWVIFRAESMLMAWEYIYGMFDMEIWKVSYRFFLYPMHNEAWLVVLMLVVEWLLRGKEFEFDISCVKRSWIRIGFYYGILILMLLSYGEPETFIYFQF